MEKCYPTADSARNYTQNCVRYSEEVFRKIIEFHDSSNNGKGRKLAVDVACGPGVSTLGLSKYFDDVIGLDLSESMVEEAKENSEDFKNVRFMQADAHDLSFLGDETVDLITCGLAMHYFDVDKFYKEAHRVLKPGGILAAFACLGSEKHHSAQIFRKLYVQMGQYYAEPTDHMINKYAILYDKLCHVFRECKRDDSIEIEQNFSLEQLAGYIRLHPQYVMMRTMDPQLTDPIDFITAELKEYYSGKLPEDAVKETFNVFIIMGRK